jgi:hypothetical protein
MRCYRQGDILLFTQDYAASPSASIASTASIHAVSAASMCPRSQSGLSSTLQARPRFELTSHLQPKDVRYPVAGPVSYVYHTNKTVRDAAGRLH